MNKQDIESNESIALIENVQCALECDGIPKERILTRINEAAESGEGGEAIKRFSERINKIISEDLPNPWNHVRLICKQEFNKLLL